MKEFRRDVSDIKEVYNYGARSTQIYGNKTHLITTSAKLPVTSRVHPPYLKCVHMVDKYTYSRRVIHSLTKLTNKVGLPSILWIEFRSLSRCYEGIVFLGKIG